MAILHITSLTFFSWKDRTGENGDKTRSTVGKWLASINMAQYEQILLASGFDDKEFLVHNSISVKAAILTLSIYMGNNNHN